MTEKSVKMFLDDERKPNWVFRSGPDSVDSSWVVVRTFAEAVKWVEANGCPDRIAFDHDLGMGPNGFDFARYLVDADMDEKIEIPEHFIWSVHSANPVAHPKINGLLCQYMEHKYKETHGVARNSG